MLSLNDKHKRLIPLGLFLIGIAASLLLFLKNDYAGITADDYETLACCFLHIRTSFLDTVSLQLKEEGTYKAFTWFLDHNSAYYLYLSYLLVALDLTAGETFIIAQCMAIVFLMGVFPVLMYKVTNSVKFAFAGIVLFFLMPYIAPASMLQINDCYWVYYFVLAIGTPILYILITNEWSREMWGYTFLLCFTLAIAHLVRSNAGIFLWVTLLIVVIYKNIPTIKRLLKAKSIKLLPLLLGICIVFTCQNVFVTTVPNIYMAATGQNVSQRLDTMGPWHTLYIGLGWLENPDDIYYDDLCGYNQHTNLVQDSYAADSIAGNAATDDENVQEYMKLIFLPQTEAYIEAIKITYFEAITGHPFVYFLSYLLKVLQSLVMGIRPTIFFGLAFILIENSILAVLAGGIVLLAYCAAMWYMLRYCIKTEGTVILKKLFPLAVLGLIALVNGLLPAIVAMPTYVYIAGVVGAYDIVAILALFITAAHYFALKKAKPHT